jgi:hypothetical protein
MTDTLPLAGIKVIDFTACRPGRPAPSRWPGWALMC